MSELVVPAALDGTALDELSEMTGGDPEFLAEMIDTFLDDGPKLVVEMQAATVTGDAALLRRAAHTLKSNSRTFGAFSLGKLCQEVEELAASGRLADAAPVVERVVADYPGVVVALRTVRPEA